MAQAPGERKQPVLQLQQLVPMGKRAKGQAKHDDHADPKLERVAKPWPEDRLGVQAVCSQQIDKVCQREIEVDMLETEQDCKDDTTIQKSRLLACQDNGQDQQTVHEPIVLEVDVVDDEQSGRQEDRKTGNMGEVSIAGRHGFDEPNQHKSAIVNTNRPQEVPTGSKHRQEPAP